MWPVVFGFGPLVLHTITVFIFLAFFAAFFVFWKRSKELRIEEEDIISIGLSIVFYMILGSRLSFVAVNFSEFGTNPITWINIVENPGFYMFGALMGLGVGIYRLSRLKDVEVFKLADAVVVALVLAQVLLAVGAFFSGSGFGNVTNLPWGVTYPGMFDTRHPVQLYEAGLLLILYYFVWRIEGVYRTFSWYKGTRSEAYTGFVAASYFMGYGLIGIIVVIFSPARAEILGINLDLLMSLVWIVIGMTIMYYRSGMKVGGGKRIENWQNMLDAMRS